MYQNYIKIVNNVDIMYKITYKYYFHPVGFWIGGSDRRQEGVWRWETSGSRLSYTNWGPGEPDNYAGIHDCLYISSGSWWDFPCYYNYRYICESV